MKLNKKLQGLSQEGGFTLIEMLIVVAIIAILVAIAVPALSTAKTDAQNAKIKAVQGAVALAANRAVLKNEVTSGAAVTWAGISKYLLINGTQPADWAAALNGTGIAAGANDAATLTAISATAVYP